MERSVLDYRHVMAKPRSQFWSAGFLGLVLFLAGDTLAAVINYDIVYVRQPRTRTANAVSP